MFVVPDAEITIRLQPRASKNELTGLRDDGVLIARVTAPPVDGKANMALCRLVAKTAGVAPSRVTVVRGDTSRDKVLRIEGVSSSELAAALTRGDGPTARRRTGPR